jgi:hypothetical protein
MSLSALSFQSAAYCGGELRLLVTLVGQLLITEGGPLTVR